MNHKPPTQKDQADKYTVCLERNCPNCSKPVVKYYPRETLRMFVDQYPITECPNCKTVF